MLWTDRRGRSRELEPGVHASSERGGRRVMRSKCGLDRVGFPSAGEAHLATARLFQARPTLPTTTLASIVIHGPGARRRRTVLLPKSCADGGAFVCRTSSEFLASKHVTPATATGGDQTTAGRGGRTPRVLAPTLPRTASASGATPCSAEGLHTRRTAGQGSSRIGDPNHLCVEA